MITKAQKVRLGIFLVVGFFILLTLLFATIGTSLWTDRDTYQVRYEISVSGLEIGAPVKYNGVRVGRVEQVQIDPTNVSLTIVSLSLQAGTPVKVNTRAILNVQGITGLKFIELVGGTTEAGTLKPGGIIQAGTSVVDKLTGQAEAITLKLELLIDQLQGLTGKDNQVLITDILERTNGVMNSLDTVLSANTEELDQLISNLSLSSTRLAGALEEIRLTAHEARQTVATIRHSVEKITEGDRLVMIVKEFQGLASDLHNRVGKDEMGQITQSLQNLIGKTTSLVERVDLLVSRSREDIRASLRYLTEASENFRDFSRLIREDPSRVLRKQELRERELP